MTLNKKYLGLGLIRESLGSGRTKKIRLVPSPVGDLKAVESHGMTHFAIFGGIRLKDVIADFAIGRTAGQVDALFTSDGKKHGSGSFWRTLNPEP